jgi:predicted PurR-regulated permease PerM
MRSGTSNQSLSPVRVWRDRLFGTAAAKGIPLWTIVVTLSLVVAVYLVGKLLYRLRDVVMLILVAGFLALILNPQVVALQRWKIRRRGIAVAIVTLWAVLVFAGLAATLGYFFAGGISHFAHSLPGNVAKAESGKGWLGEILRRYHLESWVRTNAPKLATLAGGIGKPLVALGKGTASVLVAVSTTFALMVMLLVEAPKLRRGILAMMSPARAARYTRLGGEIRRSVSGYMMGDILTSIIAGVVVFITLTVLSVPFAILWALWVALVDFLPSIGGALAGIPTVLFALTHSLTAGIVTAVVFIIYTQVENHVLNPMVMSRTVRVNPLLVLVAVLVGAEIGNWIGGLFGGFTAVLLAIPAAGAIQIIARELWHASTPERPEQPVDATSVPLPGATPDAT